MKNKKVKIKIELGGKIMKEFVALRPKIQLSLTDNKCVGKQAKGTKMCVIKQGIKLKDYTKCLESNKTMLSS